MRMRSEALIHAFRKLCRCPKRFKMRDINSHHLPCWPSTHLWPDALMVERGSMAGVQYSRPRMLESAMARVRLPASLGPACWLSNHVP